MLRRYMYRSMEIGRVPSLLGDFSFRGKSSSRKGYTFEDSVIFVHDVERCLVRLNPVERELVGRIALQEYTLAETAELTGMSVRTVVRRYTEALDRLTQVFLRLEVLQVPGVLLSCQALGDSASGLKYKQVCELHICKKLPVYPLQLDILDLRVEVERKGVAPVALHPFLFCLVWVWIGTW